MTGCVVRLFWLCGHIGLVMLAALMVRDAPGASSLHSAAFWTLVALLIGARYLDIAKFDGAAVAGDGKAPDIRRYALGIVVVAAAIWTAVVALS